MSDQSPVRVVDGITFIGSGPFGDVLTEFQSSLVSVVVWSDGEITIEAVYQNQWFASEVSHMKKLATELLAAAKLAEQLKHENKQ